jgi:hypothetical protein
MPRKAQSVVPLSQKQKEKLETLAKFAWAGVPGGASELARYSRELKKSGIPSGIIGATARQQMRLQELREQSRRAIERSAKLLRLTDPFGLKYRHRRRHMSRKKGWGY